MDNRDDRFVKIIKQQIGPYGIQMMTNIATLFMLCFTFVLCLVVGFMYSYITHGGCSNARGRPALVDYIE